MAFDTRPGTVDLHHYAGDTLTIKITVDPVVVADREWTAQVRRNKASSRPDASFSIEPHEGGVYLILAGEDCKRLAARSEYSGYWDVQLSMPDGGDPVTTLVSGQLKITPDVTRRS